MNQGIVGYFSLVGSVVLHALAVTQSAGETPKRRAPPTPTFVELTKPEPLPEPPAEPPPLPAPEPPKRTPEERRPVPPVDEPVPEPISPPPEEPPPELTGVTLTGGEGASFGAPQGNGAKRDDTIAIGASRGTNFARAARSPAPSPAALTLPLSQLSQRPVPPALEAALERNYPPAARQLGKSGDAKVRARVEASGEIRVASVVSATSPDFGEACRRTLIGSRWSAPLDVNGRRAATSIYYRCKFRID
jgi:hypothetical protein